MCAVDVQNIVQCHVHQGLYIYICKEILSLIVNVSGKLDCIVCFIVAFVHLLCELRALRNLP